jgi:hypothetical protein
MPLLRFISRLSTVVIAALAGNWLGGRVYALMIGGPGYRLRAIQTGPDGETMVAFNPVMSNLLPALFAGLVARPRALMAFAVGFAVGFAAAAFLGTMKSVSGPFLSSRSQIRASSPGYP